MDLHSLEPKSVWNHFFEICKVPHPSGHEEALAKKLLAWAQGKGFEAKLDDVNNVFIKKPASKGYENSKGIILQAHIDMVPQVEAGTKHDFLKDPIVPRIDPTDSDWVKATGTTLGADDGMGAAMALALLEDNDLVHGPLEVFLTVDEEAGMTGAQALKKGYLDGTVLLNLDGEDDTELTIGCAGSCRTNASITCHSEIAPKNLVPLRAKISGLLGGHSGVDINTGRGNATILLARLLNAGGGVYLSTFKGGTASNAIPRDAEAIIFINKENLESYKKAFFNEADAIHYEFEKADPGITAVLEELSHFETEVIKPEDSIVFFSFLEQHPNGLVAMEKDIPGAIRTSLNLGELNAKAEHNTFKADLVDLVRSSCDEEKTTIIEKCEESYRYPEKNGNGAWKVIVKRGSISHAWSPNLDSPLLATCKKVYKEMNGKEPKVVSTHGGLETGHFRLSFPNWDMISIGPLIMYPHSPDEKVSIPGVKRSYEYVCKLIKELL